MGLSSMLFVALGNLMHSEIVRFLKLYKITSAWTFKFLLASQCFNSFVWSTQYTVNVAFDI